MNIFATDHPMASQSSWSDAKEHPVLSILCSVFLLGPILTPVVIWRFYVYFTSGIGADNPFPNPWPALAWIMLFSFTISLVCAFPLVLLFRLSARWWKRCYAAQAQRNVLRRPTATTLVLLLASLPLASALAQDIVSLESLSPNFPASARMIWQVPSNQIPRILTIYTNVPTIFPVAVISNAIRLASFPMPRSLTVSTNIFHVSDNETGFWSRSLDVLPQHGQLGYSIRSNPTNPTNVPTATEVTQLAWQYARLLGLNTAELIERPQSRRERMCEYGPFTNNVGARSTFLTRKLAGIELRDYGLDGVRVNAISAGVVRTLAGSGVSDARLMYNFQRRNSPLGRTVSIDEIGGTALYLLSDLSSGVTGEVHFVDSGYNIVSMPRLDELKVQESRESQSGRGDEPAARRSADEPSAASRSADEPVARRNAAE